MNILFSFYAGLIASILHVLTGPDHLAAVMPFAIESKRKAWKIGLLWGIGHLIGMISIGSLFIVFREFIPIEKISGYSERIVGFVLIYIGIWIFYKIFKEDKDHRHLHIHSENSPIIHKHQHDHTHEKNHHHIHEKELKQSYFSSLSIGFLHGLAGISHFLLFLPALSFDTRSESILYVIGFGTGILLAMTVFAFVIGKLSSSAINGHNETLFKGIRLASGIFALMIGVYWLIAR